MTDQKRSLSAEFPEPLLAVMAVPTADGIKIPLVFREKGDDQWWDFPGGKRMMDETPFDALEGECLEEINANAVALAHIASADHPVAGLPRRHFIAASLKDDSTVGALYNKVPDEHLAMELVDPGDAIERTRARAPEEVRDYIRAFVIGGPK